MEPASLHTGGRRRFTEWSIPSSGRRTPCSPAAGSSCSAPCWTRALSEPARDRDDDARDRVAGPRTDASCRRREFRERDRLGTAGDRTRLPRGHDSRGDGPVLHPSLTSRSGPSRASIPFASGRTRSPPGLVGRPAVGRRVPDPPGRNGLGRAPQSPTDSTRR